MSLDCGRQPEHQEETTWKPLVNSELKPLAFQDTIPIQREIEFLKVIHMEMWRTEDIFRILKHVARKVWRIASRLQMPVFVFLFRFLKRNV